MMGIGIGEMILIAGVALVVIGPDKFPDFAKMVLRTVRDLRGYVDEVKDEVSKELKPLKKEIEDLSKYDPEKYIDGLTGQKDSSSSSSSEPYDYEDEYDYGYGDDSDENRDESVGAGEEESGTEEPQPGEEHAETGYQDESPQTGEGDGVNDTFNMGPSEDDELYPD